MSRSTFRILATIFLLSSVSALAEQTPPMMPKLAETPLPPTVELAAPSAMPADVPNRPLTADEAATIALHYQPTITIAQGTLTEAAGAREQAKSGLFPSLSVGTGYVGVNASPSSLIVNQIPGKGESGYMTFATLRQLVFDFNHTRELAREAADRERAAKADLTRAQSDLVLQVKQAFYTYVQNVQEVRVNESNLRNSQDHLALAEAQLKAGVGLPSDVVRAETAVQDAILNLNLAHVTTSLSRVTLANAMGIDPRTPIQAAETEEPVVPAGDLNALVDLGLQRRPEIIEAIANVEAARHGVSAARSGNSPAIVAEAGWTAFNMHNTSALADVNEDSVSLALQWTPWDSGLTSGEIKQARGALAIAQAQLRSSKLTVTSDVSQAYLNIKTAEQRIVTAQAEVANAETGERLTHGRYRAGMGVFLDVLDAQAALETAQTNLVNARFAENQARAALAHAIAQPQRAASGG
jgi:outer membrane protein TolC